MFWSDWTFYNVLRSQYKKEKNMCKIGPFLQIDDNMQMRFLTSLVKYSKTFQFKGFHKKNTTTKGGRVGTRQYKYYYNTVCTKFEIKHDKTQWL